VEIWRLKGTTQEFGAKIYRSPRFANPEQLLHESKILRKLTYPSLVKGYGIILPKKAGDPMVVLMEKCPGGTLKTASLDLTGKAKAVVSLLKAMLHLHSLKIVHCDLQPGNVLMASDGTAKISGFGSAKLIELGIAAAQAIDTTLYAAPELCRRARPTFESDVWTLGLTLYELVEGLPAFDPALRAFALLKTKMSDARTTIFRSSTPALKAVITRCWSAEAASRPTMLRSSTSYRRRSGRSCAARTRRS
jgi:serine/threonine protein kinase